MIVEFKLIEPEHVTRSPFLQSERSRAIHDLEENNHFSLLKFPEVQLKVTLSIDHERLYFQFKSAATDEELPAIALSPRPYRKFIQDYFLMVESYEHIRAEGTLHKLEAVDMARRAIHNEAAELLTERLADKIAMDFETARRLFTLICVLHLGQGKQL